MSGIPHNANVNSYTLDKVLVSSFTFTDLVFNSVSQSLSHLGVTRLGAAQALQGQVVADPKDRAALAAILALSVGKPGRRRG